MGTFLSALLLIALAVVVVIYASRKQDEKLQQQIEGWIQQQDLQIYKQAELLDEALEQWLLCLMLPQFEERTQRLAAAHQLSTVLIEKLTMTPRPRRICMEDGKSMLVNAGLKGQSEGTTKPQTQNQRRPQ